MSEKIPARIKYNYPANIGKIQLREILKRNVSPEISHLIEDKKRVQYRFDKNLDKIWQGNGDIEFR